MRLGIALLIALATPARADVLSVALRPHLPRRVDLPRKIVGFDARGRTKVTIRTLRYLSHMEEGDWVRERDKRVIEKALISSELFETAKVTYEEAPGGVIVVATLKDRHSWLVAPTFFLLNGKRSLGVGYVESDFRGRNQKALAYGQIGERDTLFLGIFLDENVRGTDLIIRTDAYAYSRKTDEYENPANDPTSTAVARTATHDYIGGGLIVGWNCEWWCKADLRLRSAYVFFRDPVGPDGSSLPPPQNDGWDTTAQLHLNIDARTKDHGVMSGLYFQLMAETSIPGLDDFDYSSALTRTYYSWRLFGSHELELRNQLQIGRHLPIQEELVTGGVYDIRGYATDQFRGDLRTTFRAEYSVPIRSISSLRFRGLGFYDSAYNSFHFRDTASPHGHRDYLANQQDGSSWFRSDVGVGLRMYVGWVVVPVLGLDIAYGIEAKAPQVVFEVGFTDF